MIEAASGIITALLLIALTVVLNKYITMKLFASANLIAIAFIYVGFVLKGNPFSLIVLEILMATLFFFIGIMGYVYKIKLIGYGIILHGFWDILHHNGWFVRTDIPVYWPVFCMIVDFIYGTFILYFFRKAPFWK